MKTIEQIKEVKAIAEEKIQGILLELITETGIEIHSVKTDIVYKTITHKFGSVKTRSIETAILLDL